MTANLSVRLGLPDTAGNFTGQGRVSGVVVIEDAKVSGNIQTGQLTATNGQDTVTCQGHFKNNNEYSGDCTYGSISAPLYMYREGS